MKNNIVRVIIWAILFLVFLFCGIAGLSRNINSNKITEEEKENLNNIANIYNLSNYVKELKKINTITSAKVKGRNVIVDFSNEIVDEKYTFNLKNDRLYIEFNTIDNNAWLITKLLVDSVGISKGHDEGETYLAFDTIVYDKISNDESITLSMGEKKTEINFSAVKSLIVIKEGEELIPNIILQENADKIIEFDYRYVKNDKLLNLFIKDEVKTIEISQTQKLNKNTYKLLINILSIIYNNDEISEFTADYPELSTEENVAFRNFVITNKKDEEIYTLTVTISNEITDENNQE